MKEEDEDNEDDFDEDNSSNMRRKSLKDERVKLQVKLRKNRSIANINDTQNIAGFEKSHVTDRKNSKSGFGNAISVRA